MVKEKLRLISGTELKKFEEYKKQQKKKLPSTARGFERVRQTARVPVRQLQKASRVPAPDFSEQQQVMHSMFGGGEKIWGWQNEPVKINNDLGGGADPSTADMFGFGGRR